MVGAQWPKSMERSANARFMGRTSRQPRHGVLIARSHLDALVECICSLFALGHVADRREVRPQEPAACEFHALLGAPLPSPVVHISPTIALSRRSRRRRHHSDVSDEPEMGTSRARARAHALLIGPPSAPAWAAAGSSGDCNLEMICICSLAPPTLAQVVCGIYGADVKPPEACGGGPHHHLRLFRRTACVHAPACHTAECGNGTKPAVA